jgi:adenine deaminase
MHPDELIETGHIDELVRMAVGAGVSPVTAIQMATINSARRFGLAGHGAVAPGYAADLVVFDDLESLQVTSVFKGGEQVAARGELIAEAGVAPASGSTFHVADFGPARLRLEGKGRARVIGVVPGQLVTESLTAEVGFDGGAARTDPDRDIIKIAVVERHKGTGNVGVSMVRGFGLSSGALASSVAHDSHNIVVVGCSDEEMAGAVESVIEMGGGQVVADGKKVVASLALPIGGLMSPLPAGEVASRLEELNRSAAALGCALTDPFMTMSFLALPVIPSLKLTDKGLVDVEAFAFVSPFE